jgi:hypothetical protein
MKILIFSSRFLNLKLITNIFNIIAFNYCLEYVQCYELQEVM